MKLSMRQIWEQAERVGAALVRRREEELLSQLFGAGPFGPANAPDVLVVSPDGGRLQDRDRPVGERWCEYKAVTVYRITRVGEARDGKRSDPQALPHWRYATLEVREETGPRQYPEPKAEVVTYQATTEKVDRFVQIAELEARGRGLEQARTVVFLGDGGDFVWRTAAEVGAMRRARGAEVFEILDVIHASSHLVAAARAAQAAGVVGEPVAWLNARLAELWGGRISELLGELSATAQGGGPRPVRKRQGEGERQETAGTVTDEGPPTVVLWRALDYFTAHKERIRYDVFRRHGLPLYSVHVESGIKQTNRRIKGSEKAWCLEHAEEMLALRCLALSQDGRWQRYWDGVRSGELKIPPRRVLYAGRTETAASETKGPTRLARETRAGKGKPPRARQTAIDPVRLTPRA